MACSLCLSIYGIHRAALRIRFSPAETDTPAWFFSPGNSYPLYLIRRAGTVNPIHNANTSRTQNGQGGMDKRFRILMITLVGAVALACTVLSAVATLLLSGD